jgi:hypothetical protein
MPKRGHRCRFRFIGAELPVKDGRWMIVNAPETVTLRFICEICRKKQDYEYALKRPIFPEP